MKCICGEENKDGSLFCRNCGVRLEQTVDTEIEADDAPEMDSNAEMEVNFGKLQNNAAILASQIDRIFEAYKEQYAQLITEYNLEKNASEQIIEGLKADLNAASDTDGSEIEKMKEEIASLKAEIEFLKSEIEEKNNEIERLQAEQNMPPIQKTCSKCGRIFEDDSLFCPFCGVSLV